MMSTARLDRVVGRQGALAGVLVLDTEPLVVSIRAAICSQARSAFALAWFNRIRCITPAASSVQKTKAM